MTEIPYNNALPLKRHILPQGSEAFAPLSNSFFVHFQEFSQNLHVFRSMDYTHELVCEMILELKEILVPLEEDGEESACFTSIVACNFPVISAEKLNEKIGFDSYLQNLLMGQFQLKILNELLLFCEEQNAANLILTIKDKNLDELKIYDHFTISEEQVITPQGQQIQVMIPADVVTHDEVIDIMDKIEREFRCALWRGQKVNLAFREYLKENSCVKSFG